MVVDYPGPGTRPTSLPRDATDVKFLSHEANADYLPTKDDHHMLRLSPSPVCVPISRVTRWECADVDESLA